MKRIFFLLLAAAVLTGCNKKQTPAHPEWTYGSVVYEVNIRQFSPEGTFKGVEAQLPRLKELGVDVLWLMPMYEIGIVERKGTLGSYYAISDYKKVNPEFGTMEDFQSLVDKAHELGFKIILDWVANQTAPDNVWMNEKPADFYEREPFMSSTGRTPAASIMRTRRSGGPRTMPCASGWPRAWTASAATPPARCPPNSGRPSSPK